MGGKTVEHRQRLRISPYTVHLPAANVFSNANNFMLIIHCNSVINIQFIHSHNINSFHH